jgi:hypothetical protein
MYWRGFGFVHHSRSIFCHQVPNPNLTIRNFSIAVSGEAGECQFDFSDEWLHQQHRSAVATHCWHPKQCGKHIEDDMTSVMQCSVGSTQKTGHFFGLDATKFMGHYGFTDYLASLTKHKFLSRDQVIQRTHNFVDDHSKRVLVVMVFYSPSAGTSTVMQVREWVRERERETGATSCGSWWHPKARPYRAEANAPADPNISGGKVE